LQATPSFLNDVVNIREYSDSYHNTNQKYHAKGYSSYRSDGLFEAWQRRGFLALNFIIGTKIDFNSSLSKKHETPAFTKLLTIAVLLFCRQIYFFIVILVFFE
jgi:hypothetical protein